VRKKEKMEKRIMELLKRQVEVDQKDDKEEKGQDIFRGLNRKKQEERWKRKAERIREFLKGNGEKIRRAGKEIKSNVTDVYTGQGFSDAGSAVCDAREVGNPKKEALGFGTFSVSGRAGWVSLSEGEDSASDR
jgi:hypothetical protein